MYVLGGSAQCCAALRLLWACACRGRRTRAAHAPPRAPRRRPNLVGGLAAAGILLFSGSCYAAALKEDRALGKLAPYGGFAFMAAWLALAL